MKIRALTNGNVIDAHEDAAKILIEANIYERVSDKEKLTSELTPPVPAPVKPAKESPTAVKPMTTADLPKSPKKAKPVK